jgi:hypothetical protein
LLSYLASSAVEIAGHRLDISPFSNRNSAFCPRRIMPRIDIPTPAGQPRPPFVPRSPAPARGSLPFWPGQTTTSTKWAMRSCCLTDMRMKPRERTRFRLELERLLSAAAARARYSSFQKLTPPKLTSGFRSNDRTIESSRSWRQLLRRRRLTRQAWDRQSGCRCLPPWPLMCGG